MKRILIIAVAVLLSLDASAQFLIPKGKSMVEAYGHISMTEGTNSAAGGAAVLGIQHTPGFYLGIGAGLRYVHSVHVTEEDPALGTKIHYYGDETVAPIFLRARIGRVRPGKIRPFLTADIGAAVNFSSEGNTKGFFFEPQIGLDLSKNVYLAMGVDFHHFLGRSLVTIGDVIDVVRDSEQKARDIMATGLSLHLGYSF